METNVVYFLLQLNEKKENTVLNRFFQRLGYAAVIVPRAFCSLDISQLDSKWTNWLL